MSATSVLQIGKDNFFQASSCLQKTFPSLSNYSDNFCLEPLSDIFWRYIQYLIELRSNYGHRFLHTDSHLFFILWSVSEADLSQEKKLRFLSSFAKKPFLMPEYAVFDIQHFELSAVKKLITDYRAEKLLLYSSFSFLKIDPVLWTLKKALNCSLELFLMEEQLLSIMEHFDPSFLSLFSTIWLFRFSSTNRMKAEGYLRNVVDLNRVQYVPDEEDTKIWYPQVLSGFMCGQPNMALLDFFAWYWQDVMKCAADCDIFSFPTGWKNYADGREDKNDLSVFMPAPVFVLELSDIGNFSGRLKKYFQQDFPEFDSNKGLRDFMEYLTQLKRLLPILEIEFSDFSIFTGFKF